MKKVFFLLSLGIVSLGIENTMASYNLNEIIKNSNLICDDEYTPITEDMLSTAEKYLETHIPPAYRDFLSKYGHFMFSGLLLGLPHDGETSTLVDFFRDTSNDGLDTSIYFPFCKSDQYYWCINKENHKVVYWNSHSKSFDLTDEYNFANFESWLINRLTH